MGAGALRRRFPAGARRDAAISNLRLGSRLSHAWRHRPRRRRLVALRSRPRSFTRLSRAEDLVHAEDLWSEGAGRFDGRQLRAGARAWPAYRSRAGVAAAGADRAEYRLLCL